MMGEPVEQGRGHLGIAKHVGPFAERQVGGDQDGSLLIEAADQVEQQLAAGLGEWQIAQLIQRDEVEPGEMNGDAPLPPGPCLGIEAVDQIDDSVEPDPGAASFLADELRTRYQNPHWIKAMQAEG